jgi:hypothetical protein
MKPSALSLIFLVFLYGDLFPGSYTPSLGAYLKALFPDAGRDVIGHGIRLTLRLQY